MPRVCAAPTLRRASICARTGWGRTRPRSSCAGPPPRPRAPGCPTTQNIVSTNPPAAPGRI
eukprot:3155389-Pleurochrysis_carterae.AAC.1